MKKITTQALIGQRGVNLIERRVLEMGHAWNASTIDAGIDGRIELRNPATQEALNQIILVQSKATTQRLPAETQGSFEWPCDTRDIEYWLQGNAPVILVVSKFLDGNEEAYWIDVKRYFEDPRRRKLAKVQFDKKRDRFDESCRDALFEIAASTGRGLYLGPPPVTETLHSNLLTVVSFADRIYTAATDLADNASAWGRFKEIGKHPEGGEFDIQGKRILSFRELDAPAFRAICDAGTIEEHDTSHWAQSDNTEVRREFVRLLNRTLTNKLRPIGLRFDHEGKLYHFMSTRDKRARSYSYRSRHHKTSREVFGPRANKSEPSRIAYFRHSAFKGQFRVHEFQWYLEVTPTYHFTTDGRTPHPYADRLLQGIKQQENNDAVSGQVIFWAAVLNRQEFLESNEFLRFGDLLSFTIDVGLDDARWLARAADDPSSSSSDSADEVPEEPSQGPPQLAFLL